PPVGGRIQSFPVDTWREEFSRAREAGLDCIEWVYEAETETVNPLRTDEGVAEIRRLSEDSGVAVWSVCADYYMTERLVTPDGTPREDVVGHLRWLVGQVASVGVRYIVLPFVDASSLRSREEVEGLLAVLNSVIPAAERTGVEFHLETDLQPVDLVTVLESVSHPLIRANHDIGNSAALARDPVGELTLLGPWLGSVHVKDRMHGGGTVPLGTGAADFPTCFRLIRAASFCGPFILQAAREEGLSEIELARRNRRFVEEQLAAVASGS
ncbi:MAG: sugar phosphate isomerase/epimerase, partial [Chloroflexi bacterium]|nr:sugar phosphate isomerase/epimerase [Chloroflexota bacterium]